MVNVDLYAKPIVDGKFWIVEQDGLKIATLQKKENKYVLSNIDGETLFTKKEDLTKQFGPNFFLTNNIKVSSANATTDSCYDYPTSCTPFNSVFDVKRKLPLFTKSDNSKSLYCAGFYTIKFEKGWVKSFCPKLITLERNEHKGPFKTELEMKQVLSNAKSD